MKQSLKNRIYSFLRNHPNEWTLSAEIERLTFENTKYISSNAGRRLRELHEANPERIQRKHEKGLAYYRYMPSQEENYHRQMQLSPDSMSPCPCGKKGWHNSCTYFRDFIKNHA